MKKLLIVFSLAGILAVPSVVFAEATWYGSFRGGVESAGGSSHVKSFGSRWGVKGSNEVAEGLVANYRYEESLNLATASLGAGDRLSSVGLSGGFGTLSIGRIWSASFNSVGALLDPTVFYGDAQTSYRIGNAVSYSNSAGAASVQVDLVMDGGNSSKSGVDQYEFGLSFDLGAATLAFAHRKMYVAAVELAGTPTEILEVVPLMDLTDDACKEGYMRLDYDGDGGMEGDDKCLSEEAELTAFRDGGKVEPIDPSTVNEDTDISDMEGCENSIQNGARRVWDPLTGGCYRPGTKVKYTVPVEPGTIIDVDATLVTDIPEGGGEIEITTDNLKDVAFVVIQGSQSDPATTMAAPAYDSTLNAMAIQIAAGDHKAALGFTNDKRSDDTKSKATIASMSGPISDGVSYLFHYRNQEANDGTKTNPWILGLSKSLGGGASIIFEHLNSDDGSANEGSTALFLKVDF